MPIRGLGTVYAFDLGRLTGFCYGRPGEPPVSGSWTLYKPSEGIEQGFSNFIACLQDLFDADRPSLVSWAQPFSPQAMQAQDTPISAAALRSQYGFRAILAGVARRYDSHIKEINEATVRKHFLGKGRASDGEDIKALVLARCHLIQLFPRSVMDTDRADACAIHDWACAQYGLESTSLKTLHLFGERPTEGANKRGKRSGRQYRPLV